MKLQTCTLYVMEEKIYILAANIMYTIKLISCSCCKYCETEKMMLAQLFFLYHKLYPTFYIELKTAKSCENKEQGKVKKVLIKVYSSITVILAKLILNSTVAIYACG